MPETREAKALRLLADSRVRVLEADARELVAEVRGDHGTWRVTVVRGRRPCCDCPAWRRDCSHALAVGRLV